MAIFNRFVVIVLWLSLLTILCLLAAIPLDALHRLQAWLELATSMLLDWRRANPTNFLIAQVALGVVAVLLFGSLLWAEIWTWQRRGIRIRTVEGGSAELDTDSVSRRLGWHLDQVAEIIKAIPIVKSRGGSVDVKLEIEAASDVDIPMKTDEVVEVTRDVIEQDLGLKLGKLDVHMRCAPFEPDWAP
ncbi:MAG: hypothetical protein U0350_23295 [Caldilineaceae bacterium]